MPLHSDGRRARGCGIVHLLSQEPYRHPILVLFPLRAIVRRHRHWLVRSDASAVFSSFSFKRVLWYQYSRGGRGTGSQRVLFVQCD